MKKFLFTLTAACMATFAINAQSELLINDFTGTLDPAKIYGDSYDANGAPNESTVTFDVDPIESNNCLRADYSWAQPGWFPRAVWYAFDDVVDMSVYPTLEVSFMIEDQDNATINVRLDVYGTGLTPLNDTIREKMETNVNPWEVAAENGVWNTLSDNFTENDRFECNYWGDYETIDPIRVDSTQIKGFEAFTNYGDNATPSQPGTLWIDYIKVIGETTGIEKVLFGTESAYSLAVYPTVASDMIKLNSENVISKIEVIDITGRSVFTVENVNQKRAEVNVSSLTNGIYLVNVTDMNGVVASEKITKK